MCVKNIQAVKRRVSLVEHDMSTFPKKLPNSPIRAVLFVQLHVLPLSIPCCNVDQELLTLNISHEYTSDLPCFLFTF
jgi:hypothetical protein